MPHQAPGGYLRLYLTWGALGHRQPTAGLPPALDEISAFLSHLWAGPAVGVNAQIAYGFAGVSAFLSHGAFCPAMPFDIPDGLASMPWCTHSSLQSNRDFCCATPFPASFYASFGMQCHRRSSAGIQLWHAAERIARKQHSDFDFSCFSPKIFSVNSFGQGRPHLTGANQYSGQGGASLYCWFNTPGGQDHAK